MTEKEAVRCAVCGSLDDVRLLRVMIEDTPQCDVALNACGQHQRLVLVSIGELIGRAMGKRPYTAPRMREIVDPDELSRLRASLEQQGPTERLSVVHESPNGSEAQIAGLQRLCANLRWENEKLAHLLWRLWDGCEPRTVDGQAAHGEAHELVKRLLGDNPVKPYARASDGGRNEPDSSSSDEQWRINRAINLACRFGGIAGDHHKAWVIDQMVRVLAGKDYESIVAVARAGVDGPHTYEWDEGIAP